MFFNVVGVTIINGTPYIVTVVRNDMREKRSFYRNNHVVKYKKGETIFFQYETPRHLYCIKSGIVEETNLTHNGNCQSISFDIVGDIIPKCWAYSRTSQTLFDYTAFTDCELYVIRKESFIHELSENIDFATKMLNRSVRSRIGASLHIDVLGKPTSEMKMLYTIRFFCLLYGTIPENNSVKIQIKLTHQDIAEFTGLTRETTSIELGKLKKSKVISCKQKYYTVDTFRLNERIEDEYNPGVTHNILHLDNHLINR